jgi:4-hydroxy-3-polyprenylbenzoate decarboxylase
MRRIVVGMSGASGAIYGIRMLEILSQAEDIETHLILSPSAGQTIVDETDWNVSRVKELADVVYNNKDIGASLSSGSYRHDGMIVAPCSVKTLSGIVNSYDDNLMTRAADVSLKEKRRVLLLVRETPLHLGHIELMGRAASYGAVVMPPVPAFYHRPQTLDDVINQTVGKALDLFDISHRLFRRWKESEAGDGKE